MPKVLTETKTESIYIKSQRELDILRQTGKTVSEILKRVKQKIKPGISTKYIDEIAAGEISARGIKSAFLGYRGFPGNICVSVNEELVHGIPKENKIIKEGDIVTLDIGIKCNGFYGDIAETIPVGEISDSAKKLIQVTYNSFNQMLKFATTGYRLGDISYSIQKYVESSGYSVIRDFVGHGIGHSLHEKPEVPNFGQPDRGVRLTPGMILAVEPMVACGGWQIEILSDGWTVVTADRKLCAHFEHMIAIGENEPEILTEIEPLFLSM